ncbi:MAG: winged helix-turn-helix domain-containing protein [Vicinamibacteria bacterium]
MTIQEAAHKILSEVNHPLLSRELARQALERGWVRSSARAPELSMAQTIEKNIRDVAYNNPPLAFVQVDGKRTIGLKEWDDGKQSSDLGQMKVARGTTELRVSLPAEIRRQLQLAAHADPSWTLDGIVVSAVEEWLKARKDLIRRQLLEEVDRF